MNTSSNCYIQPLLEIPLSLLLGKNYQILDQICLLIIVLWSEGGYQVVLGILDNR